MRRLAVILLFAATLCFAVGVSRPLVALERFWFLSETPSLVEIIAGLWSSGERLLAAAIAAFSVIFPAAKLLLLSLAAADPHRREPPGWLRALANWSMLDVVLVALVIFAAKTSGLAAAFSQPGLWFFATSVMLTVAASELIRRQGR